jgi:hypothetical protein
MCHSVECGIFAPSIQGVRFLTPAAIPIDRVMGGGMRAPLHKSCMSYLLYKHGLFSWPPVLNKLAIAYLPYYIGHVCHIALFIKAIVAQGALKL